MSPYKYLIYRLIFISLIFCGYSSSAQVAITTDDSAPDNTAMLHVKSTNKGILTPRMSTNQRTSINNPANGLLVYDSTLNSYWFYKTGLGWTEMSSSYWLPDNDGIYYNAGRVGVGKVPHVNVPISVLQANSGIGQAVFEGLSDDVWHTAISLKNNPLNVRYGLIIAGPTNTNLSPGSFGLYNHQKAKWALVSNFTTNNIGIGAPSISAPIPKSTLHVFTGDINIEQIGSGIIMKSPSGLCFRVTIDDNGNFTRTAIACP